MQSSRISGKLYIGQYAEKISSEYKYHMEKNPEAIWRFVSKNLSKEKAVIV